MDRYAYVNNSPLNYVDPTGHFTEKAIRTYVGNYCNGHSGCIAEMLDDWRSDKGWRGMLLDAQDGDVLFGSVVNNVNNSTQPFMATFIGDGRTSLTGIDYDGTAGAGITLIDIQEGDTNLNYRQTKLTWMVFFRPAGNSVPTKWHIRPGYGALEPHREDVDSYSQWVVDFGIGGMAGIPCGIVSGGGLAFACTLAGALVTDQVLDGLDENPGDVHFIVGPLYFNFEVIIGGGAVSYSLEHIKYSSGYCKFSQCP